MDLGRWKIYLKLPQKPRYRERSLCGALGVGLRGDVNIRQIKKWIFVHWYNVLKIFITIQGVPYSMSYVNKSGTTRHKKTFMTFLIYGVWKNWFLQVLVQHMFQSVIWLRLGVETSLPFERCLASTPNPISSVFYQNLRCSMVICTLNPDFEIKSSYCGDYSTVK